MNEFPMLEKLAAGRKIISKVMTPAMKAARAAEDVGYGAGLRPLRMALKKGSKAAPTLPRMKNWKTGEVRSLNPSEMKIYNIRNS